MHTRAHINVTSDHVSPAHYHSDDGAGGSRRQLHVATLSYVMFALGSRLVRMADEGPRWHYGTRTEHVVHVAKKSLRADAKVRGDQADRTQRRQERTAR